MFPVEMPNVEATVLWFPAGQTPKDADFVQQADSINPQKYWFLHEALGAVIARYVFNAVPANAAPWIKYRDQLLDEAKIKSEWERLRSFKA